MIRTQIYLPDDLYAQAKLYAQLEGMTISQYMREGIFMRISAHKNAKKKTKKSSHQGPLDHLVGKYSLGKDIITTAALDHNDIYDF